MADCYAADGCSCALQLAGGKGAHFVHDLLVLDDAVHRDAAADTVSVALCRDTSDGCRRGDRELKRPRQGCSISMLRVTVAVEIADHGHGPRWSEDLVLQVFGIEGFGGVDSVFGIRGAFPRAEDAVQSRH